jgi:hypothetical protein
MSLSGLPTDYINLYRYEKINTYSYLGPHMARQESGDRWTWVLNTARNAAISGAGSSCPRSTPIAISGDDSIMRGKFVKPREFNTDDWLMKPKLEYAERGLFCGYEFGGSDVSLSPSVVLHRAQFGFALGRNDADFWRSISDAIRDSGSSAPDYDVSLATARAVLAEAQSVYGFSLS